ncbi:porin family protein [Hymenobacter crusticola]|uniref:Outer membrane protein beta-barrel domain-containing protein n=1 Tax=Hymenobacter crusticola TaxID=1770526 RepID=A0A243WJE8_9BACT|nr:porin family protein [Hymenobacter crusticola]OUJ75749.1 hypothetical protein BXP70_00100 [Hymenobacter crusticola]
MPARSYWQWGVKAGVANAWLRHDQYQHAHLGPTLGLTGGRYFRASRLSFGADLVYEQRRLLVPTLNAATTFSYLTLPVYVRTGSAHDRFHLLLGASFSSVISPVAPISTTTQDWHFHHQDWGLVAGMEFRVGKSYPIETTLGPLLRYGIGPTVEVRNPRYYESQSTVLVGLTATVLFHPAVIE